MRTLRLAAPACVAALLAAGAASGARASAIELKVGDAVDVVGTPMACFAIVSNGRKGVACVLWKGSKPKTGSYGVGLAADGTAVLNRLKADGTGATVFERRPAARQATYRVRVGDRFGLQITGAVALGCTVIDVASTLVEPVYRGVKVSCWRATATSPLPGTYGVSVSAKMAGVFRFDAKGRVTTWGVMRRQP